jgi:hypothetical protein
MNASWQTWNPKTEVDRQAVLQELQEVLTSPQFCNSKRYPALLRYVVETTLEGNAELLKERTLGVEVFHRTHDYDTNADTVVRYTAGEVRKRLSLHYNEHNGSGKVQISLPAGSYVPEFLRPSNDPVEARRSESSSTQLGAASLVLHDASGQSIETQTASSADSPLNPTLAVDPSKSPSYHLMHRISIHRLRWVLVTLATVLVIFAGLLWKHRPLYAQTAMDEFWAPIFHQQGTPLVCPGGVIFKQNNFSGVTTAGWDTEYPFVSMQLALAMARVSARLEQEGATYQMQPSASTPLTDLRERSAILLGGYNNEWSLRLVQPLRFSFSHEPTESIVDRDHPGTNWSRDRSLSYSSADDYALVARFQDTTTDSVVLVLAGLGRNGTEAAAQFVTSPHYMQLLRDRVGSDLKNRNIEVVLKISVINGKTGAPSIQAVHVW